MKMPSEVTGHGEVVRDEIQITMVYSVESVKFVAVFFSHEFHGDGSG